VKKYNIVVDLDYKKTDYNIFDIVIVSLPPEIQWKISLEILKQWYRNKLIIEIPVTWESDELEKLKIYNNVFFFLEEYYTLLAQFLRKIEIKNIKKIGIDILTSHEDYKNILAKKVTYIHINNNFLWINIDSNIINYHFNFHDREDIFYKISFDYNNQNITYVFNKEKYLKIWEKKYIDTYNFDKVLANIIKEKTNINKYYLID